MPFNFPGDRWEIIEPGGVVNPRQKIPVARLTKTL